MNYYSGFHKKNNFLIKYFGSSLAASKAVVTKCLKLIWNHSGIISGTNFSPFQGVLYLYRGLRQALQPYFGLILKFWIIFLNFFEWIILLNIGLYWMNIFWMNIREFVLNWILNSINFRPDSSVKFLDLKLRMANIRYVLDHSENFSYKVDVSKKLEIYHQFGWIPRTAE